MEFDVFISYAHKDRQLAQSITGLLQEADLRVWLDDERMLAGRGVSESLFESLEACQHAIFLVTSAWLESEWTRREWRHFESLADTERRAIPVLTEELEDSVAAGREPALRKGAHLELLRQVLTRKVVAWSSGDDESFYELYCGLMDREPGPRPDWASLGAALRQGMRPGFGMVEIEDLPDGIAAEALSVDGKPWDDRRILARPGKVVLELEEKELYFKQVVRVRAGRVERVRVEPLDVLWPRVGKSYRGTSTAGPVVEVTYEQHHLRVTAARIAHVANRRFGLPVRCESWPWFREMGWDGGIITYVQAPTLLYDAEDEEIVKRLHAALYRLNPSISLALRKEELVSSDHLGRDPAYTTWGISPGSILIFLIGDPVDAFE